MKGWRFVLAGWGALAGGFVFQALALNVGQLSVVQPLLITELVFALALRRAWLRQLIRGVTWWAAALACVSLRESQPLLVIVLTGTAPPTMSAPKPQREMPGRPAPGPPGATSVPGDGSAPAG